MLDLSVPEVMNRATLAGAVEIGRHPGVVRVTFRAPLSLLDAKGIGSFARGLYNLWGYFFLGWILSKYTAGQVDD
jgi:hypothetical protein